METRRTAPVISRPPRRRPPAGTRRPQGLPPRFDVFRDLTFTKTGPTVSLFVSATLETNPMNQMPGNSRVWPASPWRSRAALGLIGLALLTFPVGCGDQPAPAA